MLVACVISVLGVPGCFSYTFDKHLTYVELGPRPSNASFTKEVCVGFFEIPAEPFTMFTPIEQLASEDPDLVAVEDFELKSSSGLCAMISGSKVRLGAEQ